MTSRVIGSAVLALAIILPAMVLGSEVARVHISPAGNDSWSGRAADPNADGTDGPFATLERARDAIRQLKREGKASGGAVVEIRGGVYLRDKTFELTAEDTGSEGAPIVYRASAGEQPQFIGGKPISGFKPVTDTAILERLCPEARGHVFQADLKVLGITDFGEWKSRGFGRAITPAGTELFFNGQPMTIARWPNEGWVRIAGVPEASKDRFNFDGDRAERWKQASDIWVHGFWTWDWADSYEKVASVDLEKKEIVTLPPHGVYGYKAGARYYVLNLIEEIDRPGEYVVDAASGMLYLWPPAPIDSAPAYVSTINTVITMKDVSLQGLTLEMARGSGVEISGGTHNRVAACTLRNLGNLGAAFSGGSDSGIIGCDIHHVGDNGVSLAGGDRKTLTPGRMYATNNHIHHYSRTCYCYRSAVAVSGVGNRVDHNLIHDAPHNAVGLTGNEHVIEFNEFHHVCMDTDDAGVFYIGRDWTERGNIVRFNYFHHIGAHKGGVGVQSIYLDDWASGTTVYGNVCYKAGRGVLLGGGRNNTIENNIFVDCAPAVHVDSRGLGWAKNYFSGQTTTLTDRLAAMNHRQPPYSERYPELLTLYDDEPAVAKYNLVARNICVGGRWLAFLDGLTDKIVQVEDNLVDVDPHFVDAANGDFRLKDDSPAYKLGFKPIPFEKIGLYADELRASPPPAR
jgi:parallel beta-helix repeat protein